MPSLVPYQIDDLIAEVEREIMLRKRVYPNRIATGRMTKIKADYHLELMNEVARVLNRIKDRGGLDKL